MKLLLDTHVLLWAASFPDRLSAEARLLLENPDHELFFSVVSLWEITIKNNLDRADFCVDARVLRRELIDHHYHELMITSEHALAVSDLLLHHNDPFDRLLVAQATVEGITLLTADVLIAQYRGPIRLV